MSDLQLKGSQFCSTGAANKPSDPLRDTFRELQKAESLRLDGHGQINEAQKICESLVSRHPQYFGALYTLGLIYIDQKKYPQALGCLVRAAMLNTRNWQVLTALSAVYLELDASEMAAHTLEQASVIAPQEPSILVTLGEIYRDEREYELARDAFHKSYELDRTLRAAGAGLSACYVHLGQYAEAAKILEGLVRDGKSSMGLLFELNHLPSSLVTIDVLTELDNLVRGPNESQADFETSVAFVRARTLHRAGRHAEAWQYLVPANRAIYLARRDEAKALAEKERANLEQLKKKQIKVNDARISGSKGTISLFIQGPSRSGKTTMETLMGSLSGVKRGYENPSIEMAIRRTFQSAGLLSSKMFEVLPPTLDAQCGEYYMDELSRRAGSARVFTNTHPARIHDAARIAAAIPNARFIFVKRNFQDNMLQIFMQKYLSKNDYAYDLMTIHDHITWYHEMIDTLADKLPGIVRVIHYEDMIADPAVALRVAADLCGLEMPRGPLPELGDDLGCATPYLAFMRDALQG